MKKITNSLKPTRLMFSIGAYAECSLIPAERYSIKYDGVELPLLRKGIHMGEGDLEDFYAIALVDGEFELSGLDEILTSDKELVLCVDGKPVRHDGAFLHNANVTPFSIDEKEMKVIMEHQLAKRDQSLLLMLRNAVNQGVPSLLDDLICEFNTLDNNFVAGVGFEKSVTLYDKAWLGTFIQSHNIEFIERQGSNKSFGLKSIPNCFFNTKEACLAHGIGMDGFLNVIEYNRA